MVTDRFVCAFFLVAACSGTASTGVDAGGDGAVDPPKLDASIDARSDSVTDNFERASLGSAWTVVFPQTPPNDQVRIIGGNALGMGPGPQGFFIVNYTGRTFSADQFSEGTTPLDVNPNWIQQVFVRWRPDLARYGFAYNGDPSQPSYGKWFFKYDGVPTAQTRVFATAPAPVVPKPGDTIRVEIVGYTLKGYFNGALVLQATDTDASRIADGAPGLAARWANGNTSTGMDVKVWKSWSGGSL